MLKTLAQPLLRLFLALLLLTSGYDIVHYLAAGMTWVATLPALLSVVFHVSLLVAIASGLLLVARWPEAGRLIPAFIAFATTAWCVRVLGPVINGDVALLQRLLAPMPAGSAAGSAVGHASLLLAAVAFTRFMAVFPEPLVAADFTRRGSDADLRRFGRWGSADSPLPAQRWLNAALAVSLNPRLLWTTALVVGVLTGVSLHVSGAVDPVPVVKVLVIGEAVILWLLLMLAVENIQASQARGAFGNPRMLWVLAGLAGAGVCYVLFAVILFFSETFRLEFLSLLVQAGGARLAADLALLVAPGLPLLMAALLVATHYTGQVDPALVIRRTTFAGVVAVTGVFAYGTIEEVLSAFVTARLGLSDGVGSWIAAGAAAVVLTLMRHRTAQWAELLRLDRLLGVSRRAAPATSAVPPTPA